MSSVEAERCQSTEEAVVSIDSISSLPNDLLIRILLLVSTEDAVATMFLSKRWRFIWTMVPKLEYKNTGFECQSVQRFIDKSLELHRAPVLETLRILLGKNSAVDVDVGKVVVNAVDRFVRKLELDLRWTAEPISLPMSLYTCKTIVELTLTNKILIEVPCSACLPSLKVLRLFHVVFKDEDSMKRLFSSCSALARSSVYLVITDYLRYHISPVDMFRSDPGPHIGVFCDVDDKFHGAIPLATLLLLRFKDPKALNFSGKTFSRLESFLFCQAPGCHRWLNLLSLVLNKSPKLRYLWIISSVYGYQRGSLPLSWNQPSLVPRCLSSHLEFFVWNRYRGYTKMRKSS